MFDAAWDALKLHSITQAEIGRKFVVDGKTMKQPHFQVVAEHFLAFALGNVVGVAAFIALNVNAEYIGNVLAVIVERPFGNGVVVIVARPFVVEFLQRDASVAAVSDGVGNPDAFNEFVHKVLHNLKAKIMVLV